VNGDKTKETSAHIFNFYATRKVDHPTFPTRTMVGSWCGCLLVYLKFWGRLTPFLRKRRFSIDFAGSASAVTTSEKKFHYH